MNRNVMMVHAFLGFIFAMDIMIVTMGKMKLQLSVVPPVSTFSLDVIMVNVFTKKVFVMERMIVKMVQMKQVLIVIHIIVDSIQCLLHFYFKTRQCGDE